MQVPLRHWAEFALFLKQALSSQSESTPKPVGDQNIERLSIKVHFLLPQHVNSYLMSFMIWVHWGTYKKKNKTWILKTVG